MLLARKSEQDYIEWYRDISLLQKDCECPHCGTLTALDIPTNDQSKQKTRHTKCSDAECGKKHNYRGTMWFKSNSIFSHFTHMDMLTVVLVIFCYTIQMSPVATATTVGASILHDLFRKIAFIFSF